MNFLCHVFHVLQCTKGFVFFFLLSVVVSHSVHSLSFLFVSSVVRFKSPRFDNVSSLDALEPVFHKVEGGRVNASQCTRQVARGYHLIR